ncbi:response regulator transcription factor [Massilia sp. LXY-6]|uniref:response regulator transcription factor n=1 Tax=Massilia sp. LXY-6 TaxID=3379823 RepID=UPI003EE20A8C
MSNIHNVLNKPIRVLVVENHQLMLWALTKLINGHRPLMEVVSIASNQTDALLQIPGVTPDLVLMRNELATMTVEGLLPEALTTGRRTLLFMEEVTEDTLAASVRCGAQGVLTRRSSADEIIKAIEKTHEGELWFGREATGMALQVMRRAREQPAPATPKGHLSLLTPRERKVLHAVVDNKVRTNKDLAKQLFISESTLRNHLSSIYQKLGVGNRLDLYVYVRSHLGVGVAEVA